MTDGNIYLLPNTGGGPPVEAKGFHAHDGVGISLARVGGIGQLS